mmetsp:Transcript_26091/g.83942  ORF Transcript_26091/g.83942 Transcript_26091/m.83942 type:complete len:253 (+) Transcript_26091:2673-3431(+)
MRTSSAMCGRAARCLSDHTSAGSCRSACSKMDCPLLRTRRSPGAASVSAAASRSITSLGISSDPAVDVSARPASSSSCFTSVNSRPLERSTHSPPSHPATALAHPFDTSTATPAPSAPPPDSSAASSSSARGPTSRRDSNAVPCSSDTPPAPASSASASASACARAIPTPACSGSATSGSAALASAFTCRSTTKRRRSSCTGTARNRGSGSVQSASSHRASAGSDSGDTRVFSATARAASISSRSSAHVQRR